MKYYDYHDNEWVGGSDSEHGVIYYELQDGWFEKMSIFEGVYFATYKVLEDGKWHIAPTSGWYGIQVAMLSGGNIAVDEIPETTRKSYPDIDKAQYCSFIPVDFKMADLYAGPVLSLELMLTVIGIDPTLIIKRRVTEKEYWELPIPNLTFSVKMLSYGTVQGDVMVADVPSITRVFEFEPGMTWEQWVDSKYNTENFTLFDNGDFLAVSSQTNASAWQKDHEAVSIYDYGKSILLYDTIKNKAEYRFASYIN